MRSRPIRGGTPHWLVLEASAAGLAYCAGLCWASVCLVASFRPDDLSAPYWRGLPRLRTDTSGIMAFFVLAVCFCTSEYLRLRRRRDATEARGRRSVSGTTKMGSLAAAETVAILATGLVVYLSVNAVTHPATLEIRATHLAPWPTEGTLRVTALLLCACSVMALRYLLAGPTGGRAGRPPAVPSSVDGIGRDGTRHEPVGDRREARVGLGRRRRGDSVGGRDLSGIRRNASKE
jgi:hypothetical protein